MREIIYTIQDFDAQKANNGALCIVLRNDALVPDPSSEDNADRATYGSHHGEYTGRICSIEHFTTGDAISSLYPNPFIYGIGTCICRSPYYIISVQNVTYTFDASGNGISENTLPVEDLFAGLCLKIAVVDAEKIMAGNDVTTSLDLQHYTSEDSGVVTTEDIALNQPAVRNVADLNARDKFAIKVLQSLLEKTSYPSSMSINEMSHYCEKAYAWADSMMVSAANRRMVTNAYWQKDTDVENVPYDSYASLTPSSGHAAYTSAADAIADGWVWHESTPDEKGPTENFQELIEAVSQINTGGGTTNTVNIGSSGLGSSTSPFYNRLKIGASEVGSSNPLYIGLSPNGYGLDTNHPIYVQNVGGGGGGSSFDGEITSMPNLAGTINIGSTGLGSSSSPLFNKFKIGSDEVASNNPLYVGLSSNGYGCDSSHPLYISGGTFPSRQALASNFNYATMHDIVSFNSNGAVGYTTKADLEAGIRGDILTNVDAKVAVANENLLRYVNSMKDPLLSVNIITDITDEGNGVYVFDSYVIPRPYTSSDFSTSIQGAKIGAIINTQYGSTKLRPIFKIISDQGGYHLIFLTYSNNGDKLLCYDHDSPNGGSINITSIAANDASGGGIMGSAKSDIESALGITFVKSIYSSTAATIGVDEVIYRIDV